MAYRIGVTVQQKQKDGTLLKVEFGGRATNCQGTKEEIAEMLIEAETYGNTGRARIHISMAEDISPFNLINNVLPKEV